MDFPLEPKHILRKETMAVHALHGQISLNNNKALRQLYKRSKLGLKSYVEGKKSTSINRKPSPDSPKVIKANRGRVFRTRIEYGIYILIFIAIAVLVL